MSKSMLLGLPDQEGDLLHHVLLFAGHHAAVAVASTCTTLKKRLTTGSTANSLWCGLALNTLDGNKDDDTQSFPMEEIEMDWRKVSSLVHSNWRKRKIIVSQGQVLDRNKKDYLEKSKDLFIGSNGTNFWYYRAPKDEKTKGSLKIFEKAARHGTEQLCQQIMSLVDVIAARQSEVLVECSGTVEDDPCLFVPALGETLKMPLDPQQLRALIDGGHCQQAPLGRGTETVVDTTARKCWRMELGKDVVPLNRDFNKLFCMSGEYEATPLDEIKEKLVPHLFGHGEVIAQPYQLLIYEEGGMFTPHRDTLRGVGNFGSCVVSLPVDMDVEGGELVLDYHSTLKADSDKVQVTFKPPSRNNLPKWQAFFTDIVHEVKPVQQGYRVSMTFHLWSLASVAPRLSLTRGLVGDPVTNQLAGILGAATTRWLTVNSMQECAQFILALDHMYSSGSLGESQLRGRDRVLFGMLKDAFKNTSVKVNLTMMKVVDFGRTTKRENYQHCQIEILKSNYDYDYERDSSPTNIWLNRARFFEMEHESSSYTYDTGNEGSAEGFLYQRACIILRSEEHAEEEEEEDE